MQSNCGEFTTFKPREFEGFGTVCSANPAEFDGISATQRCTIQKSQTVSYQLSSGQKPKAFSHIAWCEGNSLEFEEIKGGTGRYGGTSRHKSRKNRGNAAVPPAPTFEQRLGR